MPRIRLVSALFLLSVLSFSINGWSQCSPSGVAGTVNICTPASGATVQSPVDVTAAATPVSGRTVTAMRLYIDSTSMVTVNSNQLSYSATLAAGTHSLVVNAWDNTGAVYQGKETITVSTATTNSAPYGYVDSATVSGTTVTVMGWANDDQDGAPVSRVAILVDNVAIGNATLGDARPDLGNNSGWHFSFDTGAFSPTTHNINAVAYDSQGLAGTLHNTFTFQGTGQSGGGCTPTAGAVTICTPTNGATVTSPVSIQAVAGAPSGQTIQTMKLYVDGVSVFSTSTGSLTYSATLAAGTHKLTVNAWTNTGTVIKSSISITVGTGGGGGGGSCSPTAGAVTICSPANGATVSSPVAVQAVAGAPSGDSIKTMKLYVDGTSVYSTSSATLNYSATLANGTHKLTVNAWTVAGTVLKSTENITVSTTNTTPTVTVAPASATVQVSNTQQFNATVTNLPSTSVTWSVDGVAGGSSTVGTISTTGLYTAPATTGTHTVTATSDSDATRSGNATVNVVNTPSSDVYTYMVDNGRSGLNSHETTLTQAAVSGGGFTKRGTWTLDAASYTQPLFVSNVTVGSGTYNVLYVATENDSVYALNADSPGTVLWKKSMIPSGAALGKSYACSQSTGTCDGRSSDLGPSVGVTGTPVIDPATGTLYVVAKTTENTAQVYRLHALDIHTGNDKMASAVIKGSVPGTASDSSGGTLTFNPLTQNQRPGLLLANGTLYLSFGSYSDDPPYHGWVIAYNAANLSYISAYVPTPNTMAGGFWAAGAAPAADSNGNVYIASANQLPYASGFPNIPTEIPNSLLKLALVNGKLTLADYFAPYNTQCLTNDDLDLGSSSPMLIPDTFNGLQMLALGSKEGRVYLVNRNNLGKYQSGSDSQILDSKLFNPLGPCAPTNSSFDSSSPWRVYGVPAYWNGNIYFGSAFGPLRQYNITTGKLNQVALGSHTYPANGQSGRGPLTAVSSNGNSDPIVWTLENDYADSSGWLRAYDGNNVSNQLFSSNFGTGANFVIPTVTHGHVYFAAKNILYSYGTN